jgi:hypothetical protein
MSTYQPPGGPPQGQPGYVPPQDPWAPEHGGLASMPTDPIPQTYDPQPYVTGGDVWSQATVQHGGQSVLMTPIPEAPPRNRAGLLAIIFLAVLVLGGGGGYATYYFVKKHGETTQTPVADYQKVAVGQCMVNRGTDENNPDMRISACTEVNSYKVVRVVRGDDVPRDRSTGDVEPKSASASACAGLKYDNFYVYWDTKAPAQNVVICLANNTTTPTATGR